MLATLRKLWRSVSALEARLDRIQLAVGELHSTLRTRTRQASLAAHEFRVFSQWGEDGILDYLTSVVPLERRIFVEFGVEDYAECNTRFLLEHGGWSGLVFDGSDENVRRIQASPLMWRHHLQAAAEFITAENIDSLLARHGIAGDIGLLSVDVDGNDYWIWRAIQSIKPRIVVVEYNALFGAELRVTIPYRPDFVRGTAHHSNLYYGASLAALAALAREKGYLLVGCNSAGNNAFFVRSDLAGDLPTPSPGEAFRPASFRESRDAEGRLTFLGASDARRLLAEMPLVDLERDRTVSLSSLFTPVAT